MTEHEELLIYRVLIAKLSEFLPNFKEVMNKVDDFPTRNRVAVLTAISIIEGMQNLSPENQIMIAEEAKKCLNS